MDIRKATSWSGVALFFSSCRMAMAASTSTVRSFMAGAGSGGLEPD